MWNIAKKRMLEDRGASPKEEGDSTREHKAMHEEHVLSSWLRRNVEGRAAQKETMKKEAKEEESNSGKRVVDGGERRCRR